MRRSLHLLATSTVFLAALAGCGGPGPEMCAPRTCEVAGANCGEVEDGCGGVLTCGTCAEGQSCGGGGTANVCGAPACVPTTCAAQGKNCGELPDGCGGTLICGTCGDGEACGAGGEENVCAAVCPSTCPDGYRCEAGGVCAGGDPTKLVLGARTLKVSGKILLNGATPTKVGECLSNRNAVRLTFRNNTTNSSTTQSLSCTNADLGFQVELTPGRYRVTVENLSVNGVWMTNLPETTASAVVHEALELGADTSDLLLDVKAARVKGKVTLAGAQPQLTSACTAGRQAVRVLFREKGATFANTVNIPCETTDFSFDQLLYAGTYAVDVQHVQSSGGYHTNLPETSADFRAHEALVLDKDVSDLVLDVRSFPVTGKVTLKGAMPTITANCTNTRNALRVSFRERTRTYTVQHNVPCTTTDFAFDVRLFPGTFAVTVENITNTGTGYNSDLPAMSAAFTAIEALEVKGPIADLVLDVKPLTYAGKVTLEGAQPQLTSGCTSTRNALRLVFRNTAHNTQSTLSIPCSTADFTFSTTLYPGTYTIEVENVQSGPSAWNTNLPETNEGFRAAEGLALTGDVADQVLDVRVATMSGNVTLNGALPEQTSTCTSGRTAARVALRDATKGYASTVSIPCGTTDFAFSARMFPGTYTVGVQNVQTGTSSWATNLPEISSELVVLDRVEATSTVSGLKADVKTVPVGGTVLFNGAKPELTAACTSTRNALRVGFREVDRNYAFNFFVPCTSTDFAFTGAVVPGVYRVHVENINNLSAPSGWSTNLPESTNPLVVFERVQVP